MKYRVVTTNGYVSYIQHTGTPLDFCELNLDDYVLNDGRINAYKLGKNRLIWDENRWQEILRERQEKADQEEINDLKQKLNETDYIIARWGEEIVSLNNPLTWITDVIKINLKYSQMYAEALRNRKRWRERIEELGG